MRTDFKVAVMVFRVLQGFAPPYLNQLVRVADRPSWPSQPSLIDIIPTVRLVLPTVSCRSLVVSSFCSHHPELSPFGCTIIFVFFDLPPAFKDIYFLQIVS